MGGGGKLLLFHYYYFCSKVKAWVSYPSMERTWVSTPHAFAGFDVPNWLIALSVHRAASTTGFILAPTESHKQPVKDNDDAVSD